jgi:hypothetical protein
VQVVECEKQVQLCWRALIIYRSNLLEEPLGPTNQMVIPRMHTLEQISTDDTCALPAARGGVLAMQQLVERMVSNGAECPTKGLRE